MQIYVPVTIAVIYDFVQCV